jgi:hypothetical protein
MVRSMFAVHATSALPERLFSAAGNQMTKKRTRLIYDNMETLDYLHKMWPKARKWEARKHFQVFC